jgi:hypothetical protein
MQACKLGQIRDQGLVLSLYCLLLNSFPIQKLRRGITLNFETAYELIPVELKKQLNIQIPPIMNGKLKKYESFRTNFYNFYLKYLDSDVHIEEAKNWNALKVLFTEDQNAMETVEESESEHDREDNVVELDAEMILNEENGEDAEMILNEENAEEDSDENAIVNPSQKRAKRKLHHASSGTRRRKPEKKMIRKVSKGSKKVIVTEKSKKRRGIKTTETQEQDSAEEEEVIEDSDAEVKVEEEEEEEEDILLRKVLSDPVKFFKHCHNSGDVELQDFAEAVVKYKALKHTIFY